MAPALEVLLETFKALFVGDQHLSDSTPATRRDNYTEAIFEKLAFILAYALSKGIPYIILLGDLFHRKRPALSSHALVTRLITMLEDFKREFEAKWGRPARVFSLVGNHDIHMTITKLQRQPIYVLAAAGALELLDRQPVPLEAGVELCGAPYGQDTETDPAAYHLPIQNPDSFRIWCYHSTLLPDGQQFFGTWVNFHQLADLPCHLVVVGHFHPGFPTQEKYGKTWANPGSISRGTADDHNLKRELKVLAVLRRSNGEFFTKDVPIPHRPAEEVFALDTLKADKKQRADIASFVQEMDSSVATNSDVTTVAGIRKALLGLSTDADAVARAIRYVEEAAEDIGA